MVQEDSGDVQAIQNCLIIPCIMILQTAVKWPRRTQVICRLTELFDQTLYYDITDSSKVAQEDSGDMQVNRTV